MNVVGKIPENFAEADWLEGGEVRAALAERTPPGTSWTFITVHTIPLQVGKTFFSDYYGTVPTVPNYPDFRFKLAFSKLAVKAGFS